ncbi:MAG: hypothetical protein CL678_00205 [Bdellovibrionaceae bacterium]|nr:hypothetical protein [Pseudobdellovibrionaceae bacterium]|tara:strand:+ start:1052 stop:2014 length:963 start_codon:yes stop_codon:yes gene_type:complete
MDMKILIIADPLDTLKAAGDTGLAFAQKALKSQAFVHWCTPKDLSLMSGVPYVTANPLNPFSPKEQPESDLPEVLRLDSFDTIWVRKDPPFDSIYLSMCWILTLVQTKVLILNSPSHLLHYHEKLLPFLAFQEGDLNEDQLIPTFLSLGNKIEGNFGDGQLVSKPWMGHGGQGVNIHPSLEDLLHKAKTFSEPMMIQPLVKAVQQTGDRRVFFLEGKYVGSFVRIPQDGSYISNMAQGGSVRSQALTEVEQKTIHDVENFLIRHSIFLVGIDLLDGKVSEMNITAPTGAFPLLELEQIDLPQLYFSAVKKRLKEFKSNLK